MCEYFIAFRDATEEAHILPRYPDHQRSQSPLPPYVFPIWIPDSPFATTAAAELIDCLVLDKDLMCKTLPR